MEPKSNIVDENQQRVWMNWQCSWFIIAGSITIMHHTSKQLPHACFAHLHCLFAFFCSVSLSHSHKTCFLVNVVAKGFLQQLLVWSCFTTIHEEQSNACCMSKAMTNACFSMLQNSLMVSSIMSLSWNQNKHNSKCHFDWSCCFSSSMKKY